MHRPVAYTILRIATTLLIVMRREKDEWYKHEWEDSYDENFKSGK